jgi:enoyl-CoA hydratase/carnithine racemase
VRADEALQIGLLDRVVEPDELYEASLAWARELAAGPSAAIASAKAAIDRGLEGSEAAGLDVEQDLFVEVFGTADARIGVESFLEHGPGKATFTGT